MSEFVHIPVLADEVMSYLDPRPGRVYCDGTLGGAGHARMVLERSAPDGRLIGMDRDPAALRAARERLAELGERATLVHGTFGNMAEILAAVGEGELARGGLHGILLDVGTSSPQLDHAERGFSFQQEGPIDMRMDPSGGETARELMHRLTEVELAGVLRDYGEERYSGRIASRIKAALRSGGLHTTTELAALVDAAFPVRERRRMRIHPATRTFQGLRIAVNRELDELERFLEVFPDLLAPGGRCVIISFHSLEDRLVKQRFRELQKTSSLPPALAEQAGERVRPICVSLTRKPVFAGDDEVAANPRARSARLRACEKVAP